MQQNQPNWVQYFTLVMAIGLVVFSLAIFNAASRPLPQVDYGRIEVIADDAVANQPQQIVEINGTELGQAIAGEIQIPEIDNQKVEEIWKGIYEEEIIALEGEALTAVEDEIQLDLEDLDIEDEDVLDDIQDFLETKLKVEIDEIDSAEVKDAEDDIDVTVLNLGLDNEDDRKAEVTMNITVKYALTSGDDINQKRIIKLTGLFYVDDDGDEQVDLTYSL